MNGIFLSNLMTSSFHQRQLIISHLLFSSLPFLFSALSFLISFCFSSVSSLLLFSPLSLALPFSPSVTLSLSLSFSTLLLPLVYNAERASYTGPAFHNKICKTRLIFLKGLIDDYMDSKDEK